VPHPCGFKSDVDLGRFYELELCFREILLSALQASFSRRGFAQIIGVSDPLAAFGGVSPSVGEITFS